MKWFLKLYDQMATPYHGAMCLVGIGVVLFSFVGALAGFMEKFTFVAFFLYGIFLFYCAFFSQLLVAGREMDEDNPRREKVIRLAYLYQIVLIPLIVVMTFWLPLTFVGEADNLIVTAKKIDVPLIREFEHMTLGEIEYDVDDLTDEQGTITLELSGVLNSSKPLDSMIPYDGQGPATLSISVRPELIGEPGYEIFDSESPIALELDISNATTDKRPFRNACYVRIPVVKPELNGIPARRYMIYAYHNTTLDLLNGVTLDSDNGEDNKLFLIGNGFVMIKYREHMPSVTYCAEPLEDNGRQYFNADIGGRIPVEINSQYIYPTISRNLISYERDTRPYLRSWENYQYYLKRGFERLID